MHNQNGGAKSVSFDIDFQREIGGEKSQQFKAELHLLQVLRQSQRIDKTRVSNQKNVSFELKLNLGGTTNAHFVLKIWTGVLFC